MPLALAVLLPAFPVRAMTINATYDSSVTSLANAAQVEAAFGVAVQMFQKQYTNAITVNITVGFSSSVGLGQSSTPMIGNPTYSQLVTALRNARASADDSNAVASLPASDPTGGPWWIPRAEAKVLKLLGVSATDPSNDGGVMFATPGPGMVYTFDPTNRAVAGTFDFIGVAEHEISEVLGRGYGLKYGITGYLPYDLFRFTNSGARSFDVNATNVYFSVDNGVTALKPFYPDVASGDVQDWDSTDTPDAFDAYASPGEMLFLSPADLTSLDILGYNLQRVPPPHLTGVTLAGGGFQFAFTNISGVSYTVLANTNLTTAPGNWTILGAPVENPAGHFQFTDSSGTGGAQRFYRVRSP